MFDIPSTSLLQVSAIGNFEEFSTVYYCYGMRIGNFYNMKLLHAIIFNDLE